MIRAHAVCNYRQISGLLYKDPNWFNRINNRTRAASTDKTWATWGPSKAVIMWQRFCFVFCVLFFFFYFRFCFGQKRWETHLRMWRKKSVNKLWENEADFNQTRAFFIWTFSQFSFILCVCVCVLRIKSYGGGWAGSPSCDADDSEGGQRKRSWSRFENCQLRILLELLWCFCFYYKSKLHMPQNLCQIASPNKTHI